MMFSLRTTTDTIEHHVKCYSSWVGGVWGWGGVGIRVGGGDKYEAYSQFITT